MKPSERIEELYKRELENHFPFTDSSPVAYNNAIAQYLDEEYDKKEVPKCNCFACKTSWL